MYDDNGREYERSKYGLHVFKHIRHVTNNMVSLKKKMERGEYIQPINSNNFAKEGFNLLNGNMQGYISADNPESDYIEAALVNFDKALDLDINDELALRGIMECSERVRKRALELKQQGKYEAVKCLERALAIDETNYNIWMMLHDQLGDNYIGFYEIYYETKYTGAESEKKVFHIKDSSKAKNYLSKALLYAPESEKPRIQKLLDERASISRDDVENKRRSKAFEEARVGWCYIATAVYGSYDAPETMILRRFRDEHLLTNIPGRLFVKIYYFISPPFARYLKNANRINKISKKVLDYIVHKLSDKFYYYK